MSALPIYDVGDLVVLKGRFTDLDNIPADPGTVTLQIKAPNGTITTKAEIDMAHPETGTWSYELFLTASGTWKYRFAGVQGLVAAGEGVIRVRASSFPDPTP